MHLEYPGRGGIHDISLTCLFRHSLNHRYQQLGPELHFCLCRGEVAQNLTDRRYLDLPLKPITLNLK
jgi:hypothetical protein